MSFDMKLVKGQSRSDNSQLFDCTYQARGTTARFRIQISLGEMSGKDFPTASATGKFFSVPQSSDANLLLDLEASLDAKHAVNFSHKIPELAFDAVVLGERQSKNPSEGFSSKPPGDWVVTKIFLPKGGDDGEVFFNFNSVLGKGEFSIKDSDYGDYVLGELAKVL